MAWPLFLVQTKAATPFHPPPPWELQFRGDRFLLGSASRHLSPGRVCRMSCNICVTATSANCNVTLRHRANFRLPRRDIRQAWRRAWEHVVPLFGHDAASHHAGGRSWVHSARMSCGVGLRCSTAAAEGRLNDVGPKYPLILAPLPDGALESLPAVPLPTLFG